MVPQLATLVLTLVLLSSVHAESYTVSTYYIKPTPDTPCPAEPCLTLSEYAQGHFLTSDTTLIFLPGNHSLDRDIAVTNVTRFVMLGDSTSSLESASRVVCKGPHLLTFINISQLHIFFLQITSCGSGTVPALSVVSVSQVQILGSVFQDNGKASLLVIGSMLNCSGTTFSSGLGTGLVLSEAYVELYNGVFSNNSGGGINSTNSTLTLVGNNTFMNNTSEFGGGISAAKSSIYINGNIAFLDNSVRTSGGGVYIESGILRLTSYGTMTFAGNNIIGDDIATGVTGTGGGISALYSGISLEGDSTFRGNVAMDGGGLYLQFSQLNCSGYISFVNNHADGEGGGLLLSNSKGDLERTSIFTSNTAYAGGGLYAEYSNVSVEGDSRFMNNSAELGGGIFIVNGGSLTLDGSNTFAGNKADQGGRINVQNSGLSSRGHISFTNNLANQGGGGLLLFNSSVKLEGNRKGHIKFTNNTAYDAGGGIQSFNSHVKLDESISFVTNTANYAGGGLYSEYSNVADEPFLYCTFSQQSWVIDSREHCFFQPLDLPDPSVHFVLEYNTAKETGTELYGGMVDRCDVHKNISGVIFNKIFYITKRKNASRELGISSEPFRLCPCHYGHANCSQSEVTVTAYPGETFSVSLVAVGQRNGVVPSLIQSTIEGNEASLGDLQYAQSTKNTCTPLHYTVSSINHSVTLTLLADGPCLDLGKSLQVNVDLKSCPVGFQLSEASKQCICEQRLQKYTNSCDIDDLRIAVDGSVWVGLDKTADGIILHPHCPFDYCKSHSVRFTLNETDLQCNYDRRGLLCGGCQPGLSLALGSSHCLQCSNDYLSLLVGFAPAGIALVILLLVCKLTVAVGTINGLIFYANIIAVNKSVFFPSRDTNIILDILRVFIAWLNLDLGIETCFYDGMDAYSRTWLQFIFPVYIWVLVCTVIIVCYYKTWAVRMFGRNSVAVLATLFLLSYAKLLRTVITALSFTFLEYPDGSEVAVWLYDGNVRYLQGKHIPLFLVAMIVLLLLFLPYTVLLSLGQWIQARSRSRLFLWISDYRVKAFLDAYHGPFKHKHRYWHGLLLVVRSCLFLVFAFNRLGNPNVNLLAIGVCTIALLALLLLIGGNVYVNWYLQILDISFIVNTGVFAAATLYLRHTGGNQAALVYTSVGIALVTFVEIIIYHVTMQLKDSPVWRDIIYPKLQRHQRQWVAVPLEDPVADGGAYVGPPHPSATFINLRETLLEDSVPDVEDEHTVVEPERCIVQHHAQPTQTVVNLQELIREDPSNNVLPMILH